MRKYLAELHMKPPHHKKRFAFAVSGIITLFIFSIWTLATFGTGGTLAQSDEVNRPKQHEVGPLENIKLGMAASLEGIKNSFSGIKNILDIEPDNTELRGSVLNTYGQ
jgi:hypothetical protein